MVIILEKKIQTHPGRFKFYWFNYKKKIGGAGGRGEWSEGKRVKGRERRGWKERQIDRVRENSEGWAWRRKDRGEREKINECQPWSFPGNPIVTAQGNLWAETGMTTVLTVRGCKRRNLCSPAFGTCLPPWPPGSHRRSQHFDFKFGFVVPEMLLII